MKNRITGILTMLLIALQSFAGYDVLFCTGTDSLGNCKENSNEFKWTGDQMKVQALVINKDGLNTTQLNFNVFTMDDKGGPDLWAQLGLKVSPTRLYAVKDIVFVKPGRYKVDVYNAKNDLISTAFVTITDR